MKEIGGYFGLEPLISNEYYSDLIAVNTARNGLLYLLRMKKIKKLYIPYFLCDSISSVCTRERCAYEYYNVTEDFYPIFDKKLDADEYLYVVNYYGQISNERIELLKRTYINIIFDNVQAFFQQPVNDIDTLYSCRKFFGVPDGAYVSTDAALIEPLPTDCSMNRMKHILGRFEKDCGSDFYNDFRENDDSFAVLPLCAMSKLTHNLLGAINYRAIKAKREENFLYLDEQLGSLNRLKLRMPEGPYAYPFFCQNGTAIRKRMAEQKIYIPTLWPEVIHLGQVLEQDFAENILPLPCDQRYGKEDMERVVIALLQYI